MKILLRGEDSQVRDPFRPGLDGSLSLLPSFPPSCLAGTALATSSSLCPLFWGLFLNLFIWLCWVSVAVRGLSLVVVSGGHALVAEHRLGTWASVIVVTGLVASWHMGSSLTRDQTHIPCIGRWILNPWTTTEVLLWGLCHDQKPMSHSNWCLGRPTLSLTGSPSQVEEAEDISPGILLWGIEGPASGLHLHSFPPRLP